ncbi:MULTISPECIES: AAA-like domain-containing protein [unclassified Nostoc]|uniref:AAA-like domain-containing protein n=1 Tax=unclassified Nostoc TaxID=2593658 RepID=UPI002AD5898D|nr:AAA-like domain-containing protein [Nostoc sp. DedQUE03]MDZ7976335.1 AAA-like domain-containing protein [Nostoc sp. DedQUE03]MDZ8047949.1 AAA-like domain-containing protein [Nostoc sp. DedQUE02]
MKQSKSTRKRGLVLTIAGLKRLQAAILAMEKVQNNGHRFTLEDLGDRMNVSTKTLNRLWSLNTGVDQKTLKLCFSAFNLELNREDYAIVNEPNHTESSQDYLVFLDTKKLKISPSLPLDLFATQQHNQLENLWSYPDGPVALDSPFYVERPPIEELVYREVIQPGCVIRIRAPREMGKTSLVLRLLAFAQMQGYRSVNVNCNQIDSSCLTDLNKLLRSLCWQIATELGIDPKLNDKWDEEIGCKLSCSLYLQSYLLKQSQNPVVLVLNEVDRFFEYPEIAQEFFGLLRSWYEEARQHSNLQKLRLVVVYSTEVYVSLDINRSPFNIGLPIHLPEFIEEQVKYLAQRHGLDWNSSNEVTQLMSLVGGHPALIRIALYYLCCQGMTLEELIQDAIANGGIYRYHLWRHWAILQENPSLVKAYIEVVNTKQSVALNPIDAHKLESLGLIAYEGDRILPRCELYRAYFKKQLGVTEFEYDSLQKRA